MREACPDPLPGEFDGTERSDNGWISERSNNTLRPIRFADGICIGGDDDVSLCGVKTRLPRTRYPRFFHVYRVSPARDTLQLALSHESSEGLRMQASSFYIACTDQAVMCREFENLL